jgi:uroporphyrinogen III methyltransferase/synthase
LLVGRRIVVTRAAGRAGWLSTALRSAGAEVIEMAATRIERLDSTPLRGALDRLGEFGWVIFTSRTAVEVFWDALMEMGRSGRALGGVKIAVVGPATAEALGDRGISTHASPARFVAEGLLDVLRARNDVRGARVLYPVAEGARDVLPRGLAAIGATVEAIPIYRSVPDGAGGAAVRSALERDEIDLVTFTAPSAVKGFVRAVSAKLAQRAPAATIGPVTSAAVREAGIEVAVEARESTITGLVRSIIDWAG